MYCICHLKKISLVGIDIGESRLLVAKGWNDGGMGVATLIGTEFPFWITKTGWN